MRVMKNLSVQTNNHWKPRVMILDCAQCNVGFAKKCMRLEDTECLKDIDVLKFQNHFGDWMTGSDRYAKCGLLKYGDQDIDWGYLKMAALGAGVDDIHPINSTQLTINST
eukprot:610024_1